jgi:serine protease AprX
VAHVRRARWGALLALLLVALAPALQTTPAAAAVGDAVRLTKMSPGFARDIGQLAGDARYGAFVHFAGGTPAGHRKLLRSLGLKVTNDFEKYAHAVYAVGPVAAFRALMADRRIAYLEDNAALQWHMNTAGWATRVRVAQEPVAGGPYQDAQGRVLRGQGQTLVVVDSGLNALHPDFAGRVLHNYKVVCPLSPFLVDAREVCAAAQYVDVGITNSDTTGGHGTHCAGIAAGGGQSSVGNYPDAAATPQVKGTHTGVAPEANIIAYGVGEGINVLFAAEAFRHILDQLEAGNPDNIVAVTNSYGNAAGTAFSANAISTKLGRAIVDRGVTVLYSAGNGDTLGNGGDGSADMTSSTCKDPYPGIMCIANYDDGGTGSITGGLDSSSSRGDIGRPETYPDLAAPGVQITATCLQPVPGQGVCATGAETGWQPYYGTISGTSMATPHVAGAVLLMHQARPDLAPAQIESLLQATARRLTTEGPYEPDPQNPGSQINFAMGAGLLNLPAALDQGLVAHTGVIGTGEQLIAVANPTQVGSAMDVTRLTMEETAPGVQPAGITYRLTVPKADGFLLSPTKTYIYQVVQNVDGVAVSTAVSNSKKGGLTLLPGGNGNASGLTRSGNVISFFVPYTQMGTPPAGSVIHNIAVHVYDGTLTAQAVSTTPASFVAGGPVENSRPVYGKPFTVTQEGVAEIQSACTGLTIATDGSGDPLAPVPGNDLRKLALTQTTPGKMVFTLDTDAGQDQQPPDTAWYVTLKLASGAYKGLHMAYTPVQVFESYDVQPNGSGGYDGRFADSTTFQPLDPASHYDAAEGRITLVLDPADIGLAPGSVIAGFNAGTSVSSDPLWLGVTEVVDEMPNGLGFTSSSYVLPSSACP